ncbi:MAG: hypothetical protein JNM65_06795 [Verrucomicrobiaceae bacterium]|nr:hypothetical protein [Verrucomicrobiaceae bacterium]
MSPPFVFFARFTAANAPFIRGFIAAVVPPAERGHVIDASGNLSQTGLRRLRNALFVHAYGTSPESLNALARLTESIDASDLNLARALLTMAPRFADQNARIAAGALHPLSITENLAQALQKLADLRAREESVKNWLEQDRIPGIGDAPGPVTTTLVQSLHSLRQKPRQLIDTLDRYAKAVEGAGDPRQMGMFGEEKPDALNLWKLAVEWKQPTLGMSRKAPNGQPSNLNEAQWHQVRTPQFKAWFGDWEALAEQQRFDDFLDRALADHAWGGSMTWRTFDADEIRAAKQLLGLDAAGFTHEINANQIRHAQNQHSELTQQDLRQLMVVLDAWDYIEAGTPKQGFQSLRYVKQMPDGLLYYIERQFPTSRDKSPRGVIYTAWKESGPSTRSATGGNQRPRYARSAGTARRQHAMSNGRINPDSVSKVIDENGEPRVVYHGTEQGGFDRFETNRRSKVDGAYWFSDNLQLSKTYAGRGDEIIPAPDEDGHYDDQRGIYSVFLNIRDSHEFDFEGANWDGQVKHPTNFELLDEDGDVVDFAYSEAEAQSAIEEGRAASFAPVLDLFTSTDNEVRQAMQQGKDGAILRNVEDPGSNSDGYGEQGTVFAVFDQTQIKSATANNGDFDGSNPSILAMGRKAVDTGTPLTPALPAPLPPKTALKLYRKLTAQQDAGTPLNPGQSQALERAERSLGQLFLFDTPNKTLQPAQDLVLEQQNASRATFADSSPQQLKLFMGRKAADLAEVNPQRYFDLDDVRLPASKQPAARAAIAAAGNASAAPYPSQPPANAGKLHNLRKRMEQRRAAALRDWRGLTTGDKDAIAAAFENNNGRISSLLHEFIQQGIPGFDIRGAVIESPQDFAAYNLAVRTPYFESVKIAVLGDGKQVIHSQIVHVGSLNESIFSPVLIAGIIDSARLAHPRLRIEGFLIAHNHPSGTTDPSQADSTITRRVREIADTLGVPFLDHIITNGSSYYSFREHGLIYSGTPVAESTRPRKPKLPVLPAPAQPPPRTPHNGGEAILADWEVVPSGDDTARPKVTQLDSMKALVAQIGTAAPLHHHILYFDTRNKLRAVERVPSDAKNIAARAITGAAREGASGIAIGFAPRPDATASMTEHERSIHRRLRDAMQAAGLRYLDAGGFDPSSQKSWSAQEMGLMEEPDSPRPELAMSRKAPNGQPSNLNEAQWHQVRTPQFKAWFGDWEALAHKLFLEGAPIVALTGHEFGKVPGESLVDRVAQWFDEQLGGRAVNPELGEVVLNKRGVQDSMAHGIGRAKAAAFAAIPDVIAKGRIIDRQTNWKARGYDTAVIAAPVQVGAETRIVAVVLIRDKGSNRFYLHEAYTKERIQEAFKTGAAASSGTSGAPLDSLQPLLHSILSINPDSVSKVIDENGEPLVVYRGRKEVGEVPVFGVDGAHFTPEKEYAESYAEGDDGNTIAVFAKSSKPLSIASAAMRSNSWKEFKDALESQGLPLTTPARLFEWSQNRKYTNTKTIGEAIAALESDETFRLFKEDLSSSFTDNLGHAAWAVGFDSIHTLEHGNVELPVWILKEATQIKSATANNGEFDGSNPSILAMGRKAVEMPGYPRTLSHPPSQNRPQALPQTHRPAGRRLQFPTPGSRPCLAA